MRPSNVNSLVKANATVQFDKGIVGCVVQNSKTHVPSSFLAISKSFESTISFSSLGGFKPGAMVTKQTGNPKVIKTYFNPAFEGREGVEV